MRVLASSLKVGDRFSFAGLVGVFTVNHTRRDRQGTWVDYRKQNGTCDATHLPYGTSVELRS